MIAGRTRAAAGIPLASSRLRIYHSRTRMSLELCILASGSAGNCSLLRTPSGVILIDAGIGPRIAGRRLNGTGVTLADIRAVCLTHLDSDHFRPSWVRVLARHKALLFVART